MAPNERPLRLLALDGGGIRGLSELLILKRIMFVLNQKFDPTVQRPLRPCHFFDLIAGTSTGGLIAIMLGVLEMDVDTCIEKYLALAPEIFPEEGFVSGSTLGKLFKGARGTARFDGDKLEGFVKNLVSEKFQDSGPDTPFDSVQANAGTSSCRVFVCTTNADTSTGFLLRNYVSSWEPSTGCTVWQAARATSAAPTFFPPIRFGTPAQNWVDGGLRHNNPVRALYDEARRIWPTQSGRKIGCIISIGAGDPPLHAVGKRGKDLLQALVKISTDTKQTAREFRNEMEHLPPADGFKYFRLNAGPAVAAIGLEEWKVFDRLTGATNDYLNDSKNVMDDCAACLGSLVSSPIPPLPTPGREPRVEYLHEKRSLDLHMAWLKFPDSSEYYNQARGKHTKYTGQWFLEGDFKDWKQTKSSVLWLHGKAGCGKTILSSTAIDELKNNGPAKLAYFYFSFRRTEKQGVIALKYSLLVQLVHQLVVEDPTKRGWYYIPEAFHALYGQNQPASLAPTKQEVDVTLMQVLSECKQAYIVIDALDECPLREDRPQVLEFLVELCRHAPKNVHILITSREEEDIKTAFSELKYGLKRVSIQNKQVDSDIRKHVERCMTDDPRIKGKTWPPSLRADIVKELTKKADGVFRWVDCQITELSECRREKEVREALVSLPKDLDETYARMLSRIDSGRYKHEARVITHWLAFSKRPLTLREAAEAAGLTGPTQEQIFEPANRFGDPAELLDVLAGLVILSDPGTDMDELLDLRGGHSQPALEVHVANYDSGNIKGSAVESDDSDLSSVVDGEDEEQEDHIHISGAGILKSQPVKRLAAQPVSPPPSHRHNSGQGASSLSPSSSEPRLGLQPALKSGPYEYDMRPENSDRGESLWDKSPSPLDTQIVFAHFSVKEYLTCDRVQPDHFRIVDSAAQELIFEGCLAYILNYDMTTHPRTGLAQNLYPLLRYSCQFWLAHLNDFFQITNRPTTSFTLQRCVENAGFAVLFSARAAIGMPSKGSEQPLIHSLRLLAEKSNKNQELKNAPLDFNFDNVISLHSASLTGNIELINLLLDGGADIAWWIPSIPYGLMPSWERRWGQFVGDYVRKPGTALHCAVRAGHSSAVKLLIERGAPIEAVRFREPRTKHSRSGWTPLHEAADNGNEAIAAILLDHGADIEAGYWTTSTVIMTETALSLAKGKSRQHIAEFLCQNGAQVGPRRPLRDASGRGPLHLAVEAGHLGVVKLLVERGANINKAVLVS